MENSISSKNQSSFLEFDTEKDKIIILRVKPAQPEGENPPPPNDDSQPPEPQPDNVKDPFEETPPPPKGEGQDGEGQDGEGQDGEGQDGEGQDGEGQDGEGQDGEGQDGEGQDGEGQDGEGQDGEGQDGKGQDDEGQDGEGQDGKGQDGKGQDGKGQDGEGQDGEFGDDDSELQSLEEMLKKIKDDFDRGKSSKQIKVEQDLDILENSLSTPKDQIKSIFKSKSLVMAAIGKRNIFGIDNEQRLNDTLNEIFK